VSGLCIVARAADGGRGVLRSSSMRARSSHRCALRIGLELRRRVGENERRRFGEVERRRFGDGICVLV
jgi:hypothetical protein